MTRIIVKVLLITGFVCTLCLKDGNAKSWICYQLIHTEVDNTLKEHKRQRKIRTNQGLVGTQEEINKEKMGFFREKYEKIRSRLNSVGLLIEAGFVSLEAYPVLEQILETQRDIFDVVSNAPKLTFIAFESETEITDKAMSIVRFITGIVISYGDINQMKPSDRKMLLDHAMNELQTVNRKSYLLLLTLRRAKQQQSLTDNHFASWINQDQKIIQDIVAKAKTTGL
jgi:hypothetical protein